MLQCKLRHTLHSSEPIRDVKLHQNFIYLSYTTIKDVGIFKLEQDKAMLASFGGLNLDAPVSKHKLAN